MTEEQAKGIMASLRGLRDAKRTYDDMLFDLAERVVAASIDSKSPAMIHPVRTSSQITKRFVNRKELAEVTGLSVRTVSGLQAAGLPAVHAGRRVLFELEEAIAWIKESGTKARKKQRLRVVR